MAGESILYKRKLFRETVRGSYLHNPSKDKSPNWGMKDRRPIKQHRPLHIFDNTKRKFARSVRPKPRVLC